MWDRKELKAKGKRAFLANYWRCVLVALLITLVLGGAAAAGGANGAQAPDLISDPPAGSDGQYAVQDMPDRAVLGTLAAVIGGASILSLAVKILVLNPLEVGCRRFFLVNGREPATLGELGYGFRNEYGNVLATILLRNLFIFLWTLLFVVPGIIKAYSYRLVPYLLSENPGLSPTDAITRSRELMNGNKWNAFILDLSFLGWNILSALTAGLLGVFYVNPYIAATDAELYGAITLQKS